MDSSGRDDARRPSGVHPDVLDLVAFARDELDRAGADRVLEHCRSCPECGDDLAATILLTSLEPRRRTPPLRRHASMAAAAVLLIATAVCVAVWQGGAGESVVETADAPVRALARVPSDAPDPGDALQRRIAAAAELPATTVDALRGLASTESFPRRLYSRWFERARPVAGGYAEVAAGALRIVEGRHDEAVAVLEESRRMEPESPEVLGMLGVARYLSGDRSDATVELLRAGVDARSFGTWVQWYLANLQLVRSEIGRSADTLARLSRRHEVTARKAQALLSRFPAQLR